MDVEKLNQGELSRIEKYVEGIVNKKINDLQNDTEEREQAKKKINQNAGFNRLLSSYGLVQRKKEAIKKKLEAIEEKHGMAHTYDINYNYYFKLAYSWASKNKKQQEAKIKKVQEAHKEFTEALIFKSKPEILKAIRAIERI